MKSAEQWAENYPVTELEYRAHIRAIQADALRYAAEIAKKRQSTSDSTDYCRGVDDIAQSILTAAKELEGR